MNYIKIMMMALMMCFVNVSYTQSFETNYVSTGVKQNISWNISDTLITMKYTDSRDIKLFEKNGLDSNSFLKVESKTIVSPSITYYYCKSGDMRVRISVCFVNNKYSCVYTIKDDFTGQVTELSYVNI